VSKKLLPDQVQSYQRDGFIFPIPVLTPDEVASARRSLEEVMVRCQTSLSRLAWTHRYFRWAFALAAHPNLLDQVEGVLGPDILVWGTLILSKPARSRSIVSWHQDNAYARFLRGSPALSAWIALTPATGQSGCMRVIPQPPGRVLPFSEVQPPDDMLKRGLRLIDDIDESRAVDLELQPGEASLHEVSLIHGSNANHSDLPRTGFIIRYATPAMQDPGYPVHCVRGNAGSLRCADEPVECESEEYFAAYREYLRVDSQTPGGAN
jgi:non-heme Fe2+,alpha-ketoglutarate-dependent halogenase